MRDYFNLGSGFLILVSIKESNKSSMNISRIAKSINMTYSHVTKVIPYLTKNGMTSTRISGRERFVKLTKKGDTIATYLVLMKKEMGVQR
jgi:predicted transcriptional regulator